VPSLAACQLLTARDASSSLCAAPPQVLRGGEWKKVPGEMLLPGDLFSVTLPHSTDNSDEDDEAAVIPVDALLIGGGCVVWSQSQGLQ
jgi:magnesium-transporting ATPase (P-type)